MISIVIRTKNDGKNLKKCIGTLEKQTEKNEIIIVDSHSSDNTLDICKKHNCTVIQCTEPFSYGKSLNEGIMETKGDFVCILSNHCFPTDKNFLFNMWSDFKDPQVAGVYARQIPHQLTNPVEYRNFLHIYGNEKIIQTKSPLFNNAASMIRKSIWKQITFNEEAVAQEDVIWAKAVIDMGYKIVYEPSSVVEHLHNEDIVHTISRYEKETRALKKVGYIKW